MKGLQNTSESVELYIWCTRCPTGQSQAVGFWCLWHTLGSSLSNRLHTTAEQNNPHISIVGKSNCYRPEVKYGLFRAEQAFHPLSLGLGQDSLSQTLDNCTVPEFCPKFQSISFETSMKCCNDSPMTFHKTFHWHKAIQRARNTHRPIDTSRNTVCHSALRWTGSLLQLRCNTRI